MKITKTEFKSIIKECLQELIAEGALDRMVGGMLMAEQYRAVDPRVRMAAMQAAGGNLQQANIMEQVFADTAMTSLPQQMQAANMLPNGMALPPGMSLTMGGGGMPRNPMPARDPNVASQVLQEQRQQYQQQQQMTPASPPMSTWARLAFNSPISNRPGGARGSGPDSLPGSKKGSFE